MTNMFCLLPLLCTALVLLLPTEGKYQPTWESLDARPLPQWYDEAKLGIFIHWGVFSVPSFGTDGVTESAFLWNYLHEKQQVSMDFMKNNYRPGFTYGDFASEFTAEFYDANKWADMFKASGARYVVLVSKHHEGFTNWPSNVSWNWNAGDVGPKRDLVGELASAIRSKTDIHFGVYHSLFEWFNPYYLKDKASGYTTKSFIEAKTMPELVELVETYKPDIVWSDGDWEASYTYWDSTKFLAWLYNESPVKDTVVTNDRWGQGTTCKHGTYYTCQDKYNPKTLQKHKFENCMTIDRLSWGFRRNAQLEDFLDMDELIEELVETVSCGGNLLMNVGPTHDGRIIPIYEERLRQMGEWLGVNGDAIYATTPWIHQNDTVTENIWYTSKKTETGTAVYAIMLEWPRGTTITLGAATPSPQTTVSLLGNAALEFKWQERPGGGMLITVPPMYPNDIPCQWAWVLKLDRLAGM